MNNVLSENKILKNSNRKKIIDKIMFFLFLFIAIICASVILVTIGVVLIKGLTPFFKSYETNNGLVKPSFVNFLFGFTWTSHGAFYLLINTI